MEGSVTAGATIDAWKIARTQNKLYLEVLLSTNGDALETTGSLTHKKQHIDEVKSQLSVDTKGVAIFGSKEIMTSPDSSLYERSNSSSPYGS